MYCHYLSMTEILTVEQRLKDILFDFTTGVVLTVSGYAAKYNVDKRTVQRNLKSIGLHYRKDVIYKIMEADMNMSKMTANDKDSAIEVSTDAVVKTPLVITDAFIETQLMLAQGNKDKVEWCKLMIEFLYKRDKFSKRQENMALKRVPLHVIEAYREANSHMNIEEAEI